jgi:hypothetical protein
VDELDAPHFGQATLLGATAVLSNFAPHARENFAVEVFFCLHFQQSTSAADFASFIFFLVLRRRTMKMLRRTAVTIIKIIAAIFSASGKYEAAAAFH